VYLTLKEALAKKGATIIMACRHLEKAEPVCVMIQTESKNPNIKVMKLDLRYRKKHNKKSW